MATFKNGWWFPDCTYGDILNEPYSDKKSAEKAEEEAKKQMRLDIEDDDE